MRNTALEKEILDCTDDKFNDLALKIFHFQRQNNPVYQKWMANCEMDPEKVSRAAQIPFLPISLFKSQKVLIPEQHTSTYLTFESSSTIGVGVSQHFLPYPDWYESLFQKIFDSFYGKPSRFCILALLPSYLERPNSSLIYMVNHMISEALPNSAFIQDDINLLDTTLQYNESHQIPTLLFGVTYALLDYAASYQGNPLQHTLIMETGGMKGRRREMIREEVHLELCRKFGVTTIHSEYGMTELLSQAYSKGNGIFHCPPWMRVSTTQTSDPLQMEEPGKTGRICVTDLGNLYSCAFIATDDLGKTHQDGGFEVLGRLDFSDIRGCNLMWG